MSLDLLSRSAGFRAQLMGAAFDAENNLDMSDIAMPGS